MKSNSLLKTRAEKAPLIKCESHSASSFTFQIKGKAFQQGYLFMNPQMKALFPFNGELVSITFIDDNEVTHSAIYQRMRGYMVCLSFGEWWERNGVKEGDSVTIELVDLTSKTYRLKLNNGKQEIVEEYEEEVEFKLSSDCSSDIVYDEHNLDVLKCIVDKKFSPYNETKLVQKSHELVCGTNTNELMALKTCFGVSAYEHQLQTAHAVIEKLNGRALLADEVGLGKTIEAGLILKEYLLRGMVKRVLILTPASLITQWQEELDVKFGLKFKNHQEINDWEESDLVIASLDTAKSQKNQSNVQKIKYDLLSNIYKETDKELSLYYLEKVAKDIEIAEIETPELEGFKYGFPTVFLELAQEYLTMQ